MLILLFLGVLDFVVMGREELEIYLWEKFSIYVNCVIIKCINFKFLLFCILRNIVLVVFYCLLNSRDLGD